MGDPEEDLHPTLSFEIARDSCTLPRRTRTVKGKKRHLKISPFYGLYLQPFPVCIYFLFNFIFIVFSPLPFKSPYPPRPQQSPHCSPCR